MRTMTALLLLSLSLPAASAPPTPGYYLKATGDRPAPAIILGSTSGTEVTSFTFASDKAGASYLVTDLTLVNCVTRRPDFDFDCADAGETDGNDDVAATVILKYPNEDGETVTAYGFLSGGVVKFSGLELYVDSGSADVSVSIDANSASPTGAESGTELQLNFAAGGTHTFKAVSMETGETYTEDDKEFYILGSRQVIHKTKPTIAKASGSPGDEPGVPGIEVALKFNVAADSHGYVLFERVVFRIAASDDDNDFNLCEDLGDADKFVLYDADEPSDPLDDDGDWAFLDDGVGDAAQDCDDGQVVKYAVLDFEGSATTPPEEIGAGETRTYVLEIDTTGASSTDDDGIQVSIVDEREADENTAFDGTDDDDGWSVRWDDDDEGEDFTGELIKGLPVIGGTISY